MKCGKCGKKIETGVVKNEEYGWVCVPCSHELIAKKYKKGKGGGDRKEKK